FKRCQNFPARSPGTARESRALPRIRPRCALLSRKHLARVRHFGPLCTLRSMAQRTGILAGGNWIIDHVKIIDVWPEQDALANIFSRSRGTGGSPYNVLVDLAKLGVQFPLEAVGLVGDEEARDRK